MRAMDGRSERRQAGRRRERSARRRQYRPIPGPALTCYDGPTRLRFNIAALLLVGLAAPDAPNPGRTRCHNRRSRPYHPLGYREVVADDAGGLIRKDSYDRSRISLMQNCETGTKDARRSSRRDVPEADRPVVARRGEAASVRAEGDLAHLVGVADQRTDRPARRAVPQPDDAVDAPGGQHPPVRGEGQRLDRRLLASQHRRRAAAPHVPQADPRRASCRQGRTPARGRRARARVARPARGPWLRPRASPRRPHRPRRASCRRERRPPT
jgi:hypothetical protein